jgi:hypothetical protein
MFETTKLETDTKTILRLKNKDHSSAMLPHYVFGNGDLMLPDQHGTAASNCIIHAKTSAVDRSLLWTLTCQWPQFFFLQMDGNPWIMIPQNKETSSGSRE